MKWQILELRSDGASFKCEKRKLSVIVSKAVERDGKEWIHLSIAHPKRMPDYEELCEVKDEFLGKDVEAYQKFVAKKDHVNIHPFCLHLWCCVEGPQLPDFTRGSGMI